MELESPPPAVEPARHGAPGPAAAAAASPEGPLPVPETGGPTGPEPTRYGDWERKGRCIDF